MKEDYQKALKQSILFFLLKPVPFLEKNIKNKGPGTSDKWFFRVQNKIRKIMLFLLYYLTKFDGLIQISSWVIPKITSANLCKPTRDIINYSNSICPFVSGKARKEQKKLQKIEYLKKEKSILDKIKITFHSFWRAIIWWKNKNLIKNSGHKL